MTRERAIEMIRNDMKLNGCTWSIEETEAVKMAIEALEQPERMKLVQEAVNTLMNTSKTNSIKDKCFRNAARFVQNAIDGEPQDFELIPDEPERKGKWIIRDNPGTGWYRVTCSECGEDVTSTIPMIGFFPNAKPLWDYCPYCGAKNAVVVTEVSE